MAPKHRRSFTAEFKLKVVEKAESVGNREAGRYFEVDEKAVRNWRKQKDLLKKLGKKRTNRHGIIKWPALEESLHSWVLDQRKLGRSVSTVKIRLQAKRMADEMKIVDFKGGINWTFRFMKRKNLSVRARTTLCQAVPDDWEVKKASFLDFTRKAIEDGKYSLKNIINLDEVPLTFDCPPNRTVNTCGEKSISITTTGQEKTHFTVMLACCADGTKLRPLLIFKRKTIPSGNFPKSVIIRCNEKGWVNESVMLEWFEEVWRKREGAFFNARGILILDSMKAHIKESVIEFAKKKNIGAELCVIPGGLTKMLQPLDISVNKSFKGHVRACWESWMSEGLHTFTKSGKMRRASYVEVAEWVDKAWRNVTSGTVKSGFIKADIISESEELDDSCESESEDELSDTLPEDILELFNSDSEDSDFDGFF